MKQINHAGTKPGVAHYSAAVRDGNTMYVSGQLPVNPATGEPCTGTAKEQVLAALKNIESLIAQEGGDRNNIVRTTACVVGIENWGEVNEAYREFFGDHRPARTIAPVSSLHYGYLAEIEAIASLDE